MPLVQNESEDGKKSTNAGKAAEKSKVKIDEDACSKIRRCCSLSWSFEPCDAAQFLLSRSYPFRFLFTTLESSYYYSCFIIYFDTQRNTRGVQKFDFEASKRGKEILLCAIVRSIILNIWFVKKSYLKVFFGSSRGSYSVACRLAACLLFLYFFFAFWRLSLFFFFLLFFLLLNTFSFWMPDLIVCDWVANFDFFFFLEYDSELIRDATKLLYIYSFEMKFVVTNSRWLFKCGLITLQNDTEDQKFVKILEINPWFCSSCRVKCQ